MKKADIKTDEQYLAKVDYDHRVRVTVLEVGLPGRRAYSSSPRRADQVRVRLEQDLRSRWSSNVSKRAGDEVQVSTRDILHPWTPEDDARERKQAEQMARIDALHARLAGSGLFEAEDHWQVKADRVVMDHAAMNRLLDKAGVPS